MLLPSIIQILLYLAALILLAPVLGRYMTKVFNNEMHLLKPAMGKSEKFIYRLISCDEEEMNWKEYTLSLLIFNFFGFIILFLLQICQGLLPLNPENLHAPSWHLAFNTAVSFVTNTNWQAYGGENTLSYLVQMTGLTVQNFVSAATGISVFLALMRGITRKSSGTIGNFWVDTTQSILYILLPLSIILSILLIGEGVVQTFHPYVQATTLEGTQQIIPVGPAASQIAIKQLGTNGGGFFNTNSAHPFENPTPFSNFLEMLAILLIPAGLTFTYGRLAGSGRKGWILFLVMLFFLITGLTISLWSELNFKEINGIVSNMEGKEVRFGPGNSILWSVVTTAASNGSVNAMHDSLTPISGFISIFNIMLGEVIFGGVGSGLYGMILFIILTVFISGLMVGRTPEFSGKKIEAFEIKMAILAVLVPNFIILIFSAFAATTTSGLTGINNPGPHGLSEILYCFSSAAGNNGSAFAGLNANTLYFNILTAIGMLAGRYGIIIPVLAIAGNLAKKKAVAQSSGTFHTDNLLFGILLTCVILIIGGLTFFPALSLGPVVEHLLMLK